MKELIAKIGKGQKTSKDLTWEEAKQAMRALIEGKASPAQVGAFLVAMRVKMESVGELAQSLLLLSPLVHHAESLQRGETICKDVG